LSNLMPAMKVVSGGTNGPKAGSTNIPVVRGLEQPALTSAKPANRNASAVPGNPVAKRRFANTGWKLRSSAQYAAGWLLRKCFCTQ
jgi:hypothetical protein